MSGHQLKSIDDGNSFDQLLHVLSLSFVVSWLIFGIMVAKKYSSERKIRVSKITMLIGVKSHYRWCGLSKDKNLVEILKELNLHYLFEMFFSLKKIIQLEGYFFLLYYLLFESSVHSFNIVLTCHSLIAYLLFYNCTLLCKFY